MKKSNLIVLLLILAVGIFFRVYGISENYYFTGELGKELLYIRQFSLSHTIPFVGMTTSHEWLSYGPIYYWVMIPIFNLFSGNPFILFWTALVVSVIGLVLNYLVFKNIANEKIATLSTLIQALSPLLIWQTRLAKLHVFFFLLMPIFTYLLYLIWNGNKKAIFWAGIVFGILFSFHFSQIPILGVVVLLFWIKKDIYKIFDWIKFGLGVIIPNITLIWQDKNLALWLPYRILNVADKNPSGTASSLVEYFGRNMFWDKSLWLIGLATFAIIFVHYVIKNKNKFTKDFLPFYLISSISLMLVANILHGAPPTHYFLPIFTFVPILFAVYLGKYKYAYLIVMLLFLLNFSGYLKFETDKDYVPLYKQISVSSFITTDANGKELSVKRIGAYDYFPENYSQNYKYLILWNGGHLVDNSRNIYTIVEDGQKGVDVKK